jgi:hypothetical protein
MGKQVVVFVARLDLESNPGAAVSLEKQYPVPQHAMNEIGRRAVQYD